MVPQGPTPGNDPLPLSDASGGEPWRELSSGRAKAQAAATIAEPLRAVLAHDVAAWPAHGLELVKERTVRSVFRGELGGVPVWIKVFRADALTDHARDLLRGPRGAREARNLQRARAAGLPAAEPLAHGTATDGERTHAFVATRAFPGAPFTFAAKPRVLAAAGALLRRVHDAGVQPGDLHPGNLLASTDGELCVVDLTSVRHSGDPGIVERARALAFFCQELDGGALDPRARDLLRGYTEAGPSLGDTLEHELVLATRRWRAGALPAFGRRALRPCKHTEVSPRHRSQPRWYWHSGSNEATRARCEAFAGAPPPPHKTGRRGSVWLLDDLVVKQRDAAAARTLWRASYWLLFAGVATAKPVALRLLARRGHVFCARAGARSLADDLADGALGAAAIAAAARSLGTNVGRLHAHGLGNRDLKLENLVRDARGEVCMVDLDGVRRRSTTDTRGRGAELGRLLAAFRAAGAPGGDATIRTFLRSYLRAQHRLLQHPPLRRLLTRAEQRAGEWASAHR